MSNILADVREFEPLTASVIAVPHADLDDGRRHALLTGKFCLKASVKIVPMFPNLHAENIL